MSHFITCYANPIFKDTLDKYFESANNITNNLLTLLALGSGFLKAPRGAKVELKFSRNNGTAYTNNTVETILDSTQNNFNKNVIQKTTNFTDSDGKVTIYFNSLNQTYKIAIQDNTGTPLAQLRIYIPSDIGSSLNLIPIIEFGDLLVEIISVSPIGGSVPSNLNYPGSPFIFTINTDIGEIIPLVSGSINSCLSSPALPQGMQLRQEDCALTGAPTTLQNASTYRIKASNLIGSTETEIVITVNDSPPSSLVYSSSPFIFTINTTIPVQIPSYIGTITNCISNPAFPTGLSLSPTDCSINGTPTINVSSLSFTITASNSFGSTSVDILITVNNVPPSSLNYSGTPFIFTESLAISSIHPTYSGTITNCISTPTLPLGLTLNPSTCSIDGVPAGVQASTLYTIQASNAFGSTSSNIHIAVNIAPPSSLTYSSSSYTFTQNVTISNLIPTYSGSVSNCSVSPSLPSGLSINTSN